MHEKPPGKRIIKHIMMKPYPTQKNGIVAIQIRSEQTRNPITRHTEKRSLLPQQNGIRHTPSMAVFMDNDVAQEWLNNAEHLADMILNYSIKTREAVAGGVR